MWKSASVAPCFWKKINLWRVMKKRFHCNQANVEVRTCLHKKYMWIFEHNFVADKAKIRRRAVARQVFFTQDAAKFAEKARVYACEDGFLYIP